MSRQKITRAKQKKSMTMLTMKAEKNRTAEQKAAQKAEQKAEQKSRAEEQSRAAKQSRLNVIISIFYLFHFTAFFTNNNHRLGFHRSIKIQFIDLNYTIIRRGVENLQSIYKKTLKEVKFSLAFTRKKILFSNRKWICFVN